MAKLKYLFACLALSLFCANMYAQTEREKVEMADTMRSNGRIFVVVAVVLVILVGLIFYLVRLDKKISKLEKGKE